MKITMKKLSPNLMVKDIRETVEFYKNNLGFDFIVAVPETKDGMVTNLTGEQKLIWAQVKNGNVEIMLQAEESLKEDVTAFTDSEIGASVSFYMEVENLEDFYNEIKTKVEIVKEFSTTWYGMNEFYIHDNNGYILGFSEQKK